MVYTNNTEDKRKIRNRNKIEILVGIVVEIHWRQKRHEIRKTAKQNKIWEDTFPSV